MSDGANKIWKTAYTQAKSKFGSGWGVLPKELRALYVHSAVLGMIANLDIDDIRPEGRARICEYLIEAANKGMQYHSGGSE